MNEEEEQANYELACNLIAEQNFAAAAIVGGVALLLAAAAYGMIVAMWPFSYGFAAAGVGIVIGLSIGFLGRGIATKFAVAAAVYTVAGAVLGNLFRALIDLAQATATSPIDVLQSNSLSTLVEQSSYNVSLVDIVFWVIAVFCAVFLARRPLSRSERFAVSLFSSRD